MKFKQKDSMKREDYMLHTAKLKKLDTLEKQIAYWCEHLPEKSLLQPLKFENQVFKFKYNKGDTQILLAKEMDRLDASEFYKPISDSILDEFYERFDTENHDFKFLKKQAIKEIKETVNFELDDLDLRKMGFKAYKGGDSIDIKVKDLSFIFSNAEYTENFKYIYEGYLLAKAENEIKASEGQRSKNTVSTNYFGLFIYAFNLHSNVIFNTLELTDTDKAKLFAKVFNLGDSQVENLRKAMSSPSRVMVSKPFLKWFKQFGIDPKDTELKRILRN